MTTALLIIDVQNAVVRDLATPERQPLVDAALDQIVARLGKLQNMAREAGVPVILVQHDEGPGEPLETGTQGWQIRNELAPRPAEPVINKRSCDSFFETELADRLAERAVTHLVIGGCQTQYCIDTTTRRAVSLGYDVTLVADGHTTGDTRGLTFQQIIDHHNATLNGFGAGHHRVRVRPAADVTF